MDLVTRNNFAISICKKCNQKSFWFASKQFPVEGPVQRLVSRPQHHPTSICSYQCHFILSCINPILPETLLLTRFDAYHNHFITLFCCNSISFLCVFLRKDSWWHNKLSVTSLLSRSLIILQVGNMYWCLGNYEEKKWFVFSYLLEFEWSFIGSH